MGAVDTFKCYWRLWVVIVTPIAMSSVIINSGTQTSKCAFMMGICTVFWVTESLPLPVTSLLPIVMSPMLGVMTTSDACKFFFANLTVMIIGVLILGSAIVESNLHRRIALKFLLLMGVAQKRLLLSVMLTSGFLSMWIANTAATSMMAPIVNTLLTKLMEARKKAEHDISDGDDHEMDRINGESHIGGLHLRDEEEHKLMEYDNEYTETTITMDPPPPTPPPTPSPTNQTTNTITDDDIIHETDGDQNNVIKTNHDVSTEDREDGGPGGDKEEGQDWNKTIKLFNLAVCYSANIGGLGTLIGTPPNIVFAKAVQDLATDGSSPITYVSWLKMGLPISLVTLTVMYIWLCTRVFGWRNTLFCRQFGDKNEEKMLRNVILKEYRSLGTITFHEKVVLVHFVVLVILFLTRDPVIFPGWATLFPDKYVTDGVPAIAVAISLFMCPRSRPTVFCFKGAEDTDKPLVPQESAVSWKAVKTDFPWGIIFLLGGGMVLASASKSSGLSDVLVDSLSFLSALPNWLTAFLLTAMTCMVTEITSNTVIAIIALPIVGNLAVQFGVNPLIYMLPVVMATSMAFMLPVATPPNAIIYALGRVKLTDMIKAGIPMNIIAVFIINVLLNTVGYYAFSLGEIPSWLTPMNTTVATTSIDSTGYNVTDNDTVFTTYTTSL